MVTIEAGAGPIGPIGRGIFPNVAGCRMGLTWRG